MLASCYSCYVYMQFIRNKINPCVINCATIEGEQSSSNKQHLQFLMQPVSHVMCTFNSFINTQEMQILLEWYIHAAGCFVAHPGVQSNLLF